MKSPSSVVYSMYGTYLSDFVFRGVLDWLEREGGDDRNTGKLEPLEISRNLMSTGRPLSVTMRHWKIESVVSTKYQSQCENPSAAVPSSVLPTH